MTRKLPAKPLATPLSTLGLLASGCITFGGPTPASKADAARLDWLNRHEVATTIEGTMRKTVTVAYKVNSRFRKPTLREYKGSNIRDAIDGAMNQVGELGELNPDPPAQEPSK